MSVSCHHITIFTLDQRTSSATSLHLMLRKELLILHVEVIQDVAFSEQHDGKTKEVEAHFWRDFVSKCIFNHSISEKIMRVLLDCFDNLKYIAQES